MAQQNDVPVIIDDPVREHHFTPLSEAAFDDMRALARSSGGTIRIWQGPWHPKSLDEQLGITPKPPLALQDLSAAIEHIQILDDSVIAAMYADNRADSSDVRDRHALELAPFASLEKALTVEIERRLKERRTDPDAKVAIPHPQLIIELEPQFGSYIFNVDGLKRAAAMLAPEEAKKLVKYTPAHTDPVPEKWEPGPTASIKAIRDKYPGSDVAKILSESMDRPRVGDRLTIKPREVAPKNVTGTASAAELQS